MDRLTDFMEAIKIRLRNPFFASFIFSWLIWNWKIWIGLFWHNDHSLISAGYCSFVDFVQDQLSLSLCLFYPLFSALVIVLVLPLIRNLMEMYQAFMMNWGERKVMEISKTGVISIDEYIKKKQQILTYVEEMKVAAANESAYISSMAEKDREIGYQSTQVSRLQAELKELQEGLSNRRKVNLLEGVWKVSPGLNGEDSFEYQITGQEVFSVHGVDKRDKYASVLFVLEQANRIDLAIKTNFNSILYFDIYFSNRDYLEGTRNGSERIELRRIK